LSILFATTILPLDFSCCEELLDFYIRLYEGSPLLYGVFLLDNCGKYTMTQSRSTEKKGVMD
jgi:hypothetical protein